MDNNITTEKKYSAFISYKSDDKKFAMKLHKKLEKYKISSQLRDKTGCSNKENRTWHEKRRFKIFLDIYDLVSGGLGEGLQNNAIISEKLIIICSKNLVINPTHVEEEIEYFRESNRNENDIILINISNVKNPVKECFPPSLRKNKEILAINMTDNKKWKLPFCDLIARLLEVKKNDVYQREKRRQCLSRLIIAPFIALFLGLMCVLGMMIWENAPHSKYYADYVTVYGVPVGINELSSSQMRKRYASYEITTHQGNVVEVRYVDSYGRVNTHGDIYNQDRPSIAEYIYNNDTLSKVIYKNEEEETVLTMVYSGDLKAVDFVNSVYSSTLYSLPEYTAGETYGIYGTAHNHEDNTPTKSDISRFLITYDENGYQQTVSYSRDNRNTPTSDSDGIHKIEYTYDEAGRIIDMRYFDIEGKIVTAINGSNGQEYKYDDNGNVTSVIKYLIAEDGEKIYLTINLFIYDSVGNCTTESLYDYINEYLLYQEQHDCYILKMDYSERGLMTNLYWLDSDGRLMYSDDTELQHHVRTERIYDSKGRIKIEKLYHQDNTVCEPVGIFEYDRYDNIISDTYKCSNLDHYIATDEGYCIATYKYDDNHNTIEIRYFDMVEFPLTESYKKTPVNITGGISIVRSEYDELGRVIKQSFYDKDNKLVMNTQQNYGYAICETMYDDYGNIQKVSIYGPDGKLIDDMHGATFEYIYDEYGNLVECIHYDSNGKLLEE